jgi:fibro-slime domain-containing protein
MSYQLTEGMALNDGVTNYYGPGSADPAGNGRLMWTPSTQGLYAIQIRIAVGTYAAGCQWYQSSCAFTEKSWSTLDFVMAVVAPCSVSAVCNHNPYFTGTTCTAASQANTGNCPKVFAAPVTFYAGVQKQFTVVVVDQDQAQSISMQTSVIPAGATFSQTRTGNPINFVMQWTPTLDQVSAVVCLKAVDNGAGFSAVAYSLGNFCINMVIGQATLIYLSGIIRDFRKTHPDFNRANGDFGAANNFVSTTLGADNKPVFNTNFTSRVTTTNPTNFAQWFNDVNNVNLDQVYSISLSNGSVADSRIFTYFTSILWPIDGLLFGNEGDLHNNYYTYEIHTYMGYLGGEVYTYQSSDDMWLFVNRIQPPNWNLNGIHGILSYTLVMDTVRNTTWRLALGGIYPCDIFYAHRGAWTGPLTHDPTLQLQLPRVVLCNALSSGILTVDFTPNFQTSYASAASNRIKLLGSASISGQNLKLTDVNQPSFAGAAWFQSLQAGSYSPDLLKVLQGFQATFNFIYSGNVGGNNPRGFAFVLQNSGPSALGTDGSGLGYAGIPLSVAIEFDSFRDISNNDPAFDHVSLHTRYSLPNTPDEATGSLGISNNDPPMTLANMSSHKVIIQYQPAQDSTTGVQLGWIYVYMNANLAPVMACQLDMVNLKAAFNGAAYVGFTGGQGPASTSVSSIQITNWQTTIVGVSAAFTGLVVPISQTVPGLLVAGQAQSDTYSVDGLIRPGVLRIQTRDSCNNKILVGNDPQSFTVTLTRSVGSSRNPFPTNIVSNGDGSYTVTYNPTQSGTYFIDIRYQGIPISGSPYSLTVYPTTASTVTSFVMPSSFAYLPSTVSVANPAVTRGLQVVVVSYTSGTVLTNQVYDTTVATDTTLSTLLNSLTNDKVVALACSGNCVPSTGFSAGTLAAVARLGATTFQTLAVSGSYAFVGLVGGANTQRSESVQNTRASDLASVVFTPQSSPLTWFNVSAESGGTNFGQVVESTSGGFARIAVAKVGNFFTQAGSLGTIYIQARDTYANPQVVGLDNFVVSISPDIANTAGGYVNATQPTLPAYYSTSFYTRASGLYQLYVKLGGVSIYNSPLNLYVIPAAAAATTSTATGAGLASAVAGTSICFNLILKDVYGNTLINPNTLNPDNIRANLTSTTLSPVQTILLGITSGSTMGWVDGSVSSNPCTLGSVCNFQICYVATKADLYALSVNINGVFMVTTQSVQVNPGVTFPANCALSGPGIFPSQAVPVVSGSSSTLTLTTRDAYSNLLTTASSYPFVVSFIRNGVDVTSTVYGSINQLSYVGSGLYTLTWTPRLLGGYNISVQWNNLNLNPVSARYIGAPAQPFVITVKPNLVSTPSTMLVSSRNFLVGSLQSVMITGRDLNSNLVVAGTPSSFLVAAAIDPLTGSQYLPTIYVTSNVVPPRFNYSFVAQQAGTYLVDVKLADTGNSITGSPVSLIANAGPANCTMFAVTGVGQFGGSPGTPQTFIIQARDTYGNVANTTTLLLNVTIVTTSIQSFVATSTGQPGFYSVSYVAPLGTFTISVSLPANANNPSTATPCLLFSRTVDFSGPLTSFARPESASGYFPLDAWQKATAGVLSTFYVVEYTSIARNNYSRFFFNHYHYFFIIFGLFVSFLHVYRTLSR